MKFKAREVYDEAKSVGKDRGFEIGFNCADSFGPDDYDHYLAEVFEAEDNSRQVAPFDFFIKFMSDQKPWVRDRGWELFDASVEEGAREAWVLYHS